MSRAKWLKIILCVFILIVIVGSSTLVFSKEKAESESSKELQDDIAKLRAQIDTYQQQIFEKSQREESLQNQVEILADDIKKIELQIEETKLVVRGLDEEISAKQMDIDEMEGILQAKRVMLSQFVVELYEREQATSLELFLGNQTFSDFFFRIESLESVESKIQDAYDQVFVMQNGVKRERNDLSEKKYQQVKMQSMQMDQERFMEEEKQMKDMLISKTRDEKGALSLQLEKLQEQLNALQTLGEPIVLEDAVKAAKYASSFTKVPPEFLLGILRVESGLGTNVGGGRYKTDMNPKQWDTFKKICKVAKVNPDTTPVSKRVCYNKNSEDGCGGWGGAMGPAQFMPSTWMGYVDKVKTLTGKSSVSPWDLKDSMVAMGLKVAQIEGVTEGKRKAMAKAAGIYLAGANWESYPWYSDRVLFYADGFKRILKDY